MERFREFSAEMKRMFRGAIRTGDIETVLMFLQAGINPNKKIFEIRPLLAAVNFNEPEIVRLLVTSGANPNVRDRWEETLFFYITSDNPIMVQVLLSMGTDPNFPNSWKETPLHMYVERKYLKAAEVLLLADVNPNTKTTYGRTPLDYAGVRDSKMMRLLRNYGAK